MTMLEKFFDVKFYLVAVFSLRLHAGLSCSLTGIPAATTVPSEIKLTASFGAKQTSRSSIQTHLRPPSL